MYAEKVDLCSTNFVNETKSCKICMTKEAKNLSKNEFISPAFFLF